MQNADGIQSAVIAAPPLLRHPSLSHRGPALLLELDMIEGREETFSSLSKGSFCDYLV
jgi:hypothetical protein